MKPVIGWVRAPGERQHLALTFAAAASHCASLGSEAVVRSFAAACAGALVHWVPYRWEPHGLSLSGFAPEVTLAVHTWPEHGAVALDLFYDAARFDAQAFLAELLAHSGWEVAETRPIVRQAVSAPSLRSSG